MRRFIFAGLIVLVIGSVAGISTVTNGQDTNVGTIVQGEDPINAPDYPEIYSDNSNLGEDKIKKEAEIKDNLKFPKGQLKKLELTNMSTVEDKLKVKRVKQINPNRRVFLATIEFPEGLQTSRANYKKATVESVIDAETGLELMATITSEIPDTNYTLPKQK